MGLPVGNKTIHHLLFEDGRVIVPRDKVMQNIRAENEEEEEEGGGGG